MKMPNYVRLAGHLKGRYDLRSGWGISGLDVKEVPDAESQPNSFRFVSRELSAGRLEAASKAEFEEVNKPLVDPDEVDDEHPYQERAVRQAAAKQHNVIKNQRAGLAGEDAADADEERRKAILAKQSGKKAKGKKKKSKAEQDDEPNTGNDDNSGNGDDGGSGDGDTDQYDDMDFAALKAAAKDRELSAAGSTADLRARLREADES